MGERGELPTRCSSPLAAAPRVQVGYSGGGYAQLPQKDLTHYTNTLLNHKLQVI